MRIAPSNTRLLCLKRKTGTVNKPSPGRKNIMKTYKIVFVDRRLTYDEIVEATGLIRDSLKIITRISRHVHMKKLSVRCVPCVFIHREKSNCQNPLVSGLGRFCMGFPTYIYINYIQAEFPALLGIWCKWSSSFPDAGKPK